MTLKQWLLCTFTGSTIFATTGCGSANETTQAETQTIQLEKAEAFIDAFYSFDAERLAPLLADAPESSEGLLYYQGWAEGGNYKIMNRGACEPTDKPNTIACPITVQDDPVLALNTGFNVTDTFTMTFKGTDLVAVDTSSNDQPIYYQAREWVLKEMPEIMDGPCKDFYKGGTTPGDCARAMTEGYKKFAASDEFPGNTPPDLAEDTPTEPDES